MLEEVPQVALFHDFGSRTYPGESSSNAAGFRCDIRRTDWSSNRKKDVATFRDSQRRAAPFRCGGVLLTEFRLALEERETYPKVVVRFTRRRLPHEDRGGVFQSDAGRIHWRLSTCCRSWLSPL